jgi:hypothetical protein
MFIKDGKAKGRLKAIILAALALLQALMLFY